MATKSLWGELPKTDQLRLPVTVLKEQANALTELTGGILNGSVLTARKRERISLTLRIVAPALDGYTYDVAYAYHDVDGYPVGLEAAWDDETKFDCENEQEFQADLREILTSSKVQSVIQVLLVQSREVDEAG